MSMLKAVARFVYDFVVGDCWQLSLAVALMLLAAGLAAATRAASPGVILVTLGVAVLVVGPLVVIAEGRGGN